MGDRSNLVMNINPEIVFTQGRGRLAAFSDAPELSLSSIERRKPLKILEEGNSIIIGFTKIPGFLKMTQG